VKVALLGMMQSGKSTLLSALSGKEMGPVPATSVVEEIIPVPDSRIDWLTNHYKPKKTTRATIDCLDVPGVYFTDEHGRAAAQRVLREMRTAGMIVLVARAFQDETVPVYRDSVDPARDINELRQELLLADLELVTTRIERLEKSVAKGGRNAAQEKEELALQKRLEAALENEQPIREVIEGESEEAMIRSLNFFSLKPIAVVVNTGEDDLGKDFELGLDASIPVVCLCATLEMELAQLDTEDQSEFMQDLGITEPAINKFVNKCYEALGLISFLTSGEDEVRAWPIKRGISALEAAAKIHSDIQRGFIRAETLAFETLKELGSEKAVKAAGKSQLEGKTYVVQDGDIINFRFNV